MLTNNKQYTLQALVEMASGDPLDMQREARWPNIAGEPGLKVQFRAEDSDEDDFDGYDEVTGYFVPGSR
jgi:hypothetical protein